MGNKYSGASVTTTYLLWWIIGGVLFYCACGNSIEILEDLLPPLHDDIIANVIGGHPRGIIQS